MYCLLRTMMIVDVSFKTKSAGERDKASGSDTSIVCLFLHRLFAKELAAGCSEAACHKLQVSVVRGTCTWRVPSQPHLRPNACHHHDIVF